MMGGRKCISIFVFAMVTLLSCSSPSSSLSVVPRISRTDDAIIVDYADQEIAALQHQGQNLYDGNANPADFNPYFQPQQPKFYNGWGYYYAYPSDTSSERQAVKQGATTTTTTTTTTPTTTPTTTTPTTTTTPAPVIQCGRGPAIFPPTAKSFDDPSQPSISGKLAGGTDAKKDAWPFLAFLVTGGSAPSCVGTLISESKVLLAAQCLEQQMPFNLALMTISIGVQSITPFVARMTRRISKFVFHSQYDATTYANDIAIITLDIPVSFSKNVAPICLPPASTDSNQYVDQNAIVLGWTTGNAKLQQGKVSIVSNDECKMMPTISQYISDTTICINSDTVFTCKTDVGGPVVVMSSPGTWTLVGINSYTAQTCTSSGLKTRVSAFRSWIDQNMQI